MRTSKFSLIAALALGGLLACTAVVSAQEATPGKKGGRMGVEQRLERMSTELKLTDEQKPKVKAVLEESSKKFQELRDVPQDQRREKIQSIREEENKKLKGILTPEQFEKWQKMQPQFRQNRPGGPGGEKQGDAKKTQ